MRFEILFSRPGCLVAGAVSMILLALLWLALPKPRPEASALGPVELLVKAQIAREAVESSNETSIDELAAEHGYTRDYFGVLLRIAYLAPDIVAAILDGRQPVQLNRQRLARATSLPVLAGAARDVRLRLTGIHSTTCILLRIAAPDRLQDGRRKSAGSANPGRAKWSPRTATDA